MKPLRFLTVFCAFAALMPVAAQAQTTGANFEMRISSLEDEMRALNGQVEQLNYAIHRMDQAVQRMQTDYDSRLTRLETNVANLTAAAQAAPPTPPAVANVAGEVNNPPLAAVKVQDGKVAGTTVANNGTPPLPEAAGTTDGGKQLSPKEQYDRALAYLRQADYDDAEKAFKAFIAANPKDKLIENAKYWYAETLYVRGRYADAAVGFADAFQQNPQGDKAPDSLLKLAMSLGSSNKVDDACTALSELKAKYPSASPNVKALAAEERNKLKCSAH
ncbi:MAG: tol-pal system protein YbgF [Alphaproteobacteria bacterium]|nr:tol-pal system protein YbgF [Alphaproteobacteria bacterium]MBV8548204.1 tol-pal system protein YbgF [Alphaproteobacteria bacterium]